MIIKKSRRFAPAFLNKIRMKFLVWRINFCLFNRIKEFLIRCRLAYKAFNGENILFGVEIYPTPDGRIYFSHETPINMAFTVLCQVDFYDRSKVK